MKNTKMWIIIGGIVILSLYLISQYNGLVKLEQSVKKQWANVESSYQRRADLIPNLVNTVKGYAEFEKSTLQGVIEARSKATGVTVNAENLTPETIAKFQEAQNQMSGALSRLLVVVEKYPDLKANQNFLELQAQLEGTENRINVERNRYNEMVQPFNTKIKTFPTNLMNAIYGFKEMGYFEAQKGAEAAPTVTF
ncbi:MAG: LemA family protein [Bacteroidetes bacterium ADurb.Bin217]|nr:MAG: LemA family protein [Bacteroidetes bacterium ADurb.Bin217]